MRPGSENGTKESIFSINSGNVDVRVGSRVWRKRVRVATRPSASNYARLLWVAQLQAEFEPPRILGKSTSRQGLLSFCSS